MARIRSIKPESFDDETLCALPFSHRWGYIGLWTQADRAGRMEDRPKRLKARLFPYDDVDMEAMLTDLSKSGFIVRYLVNGRAYIAIKPSSWARHQYIRNNEPESVIPPPDAAEVVYASMGENEAVGAALRTQPESHQTHSDNGDREAPRGTTRSPGMDKWEGINGKGMDKWEGSDLPSEDRLQRDANDALAASQLAPDAAPAEVLPADPPLMEFPVDGVKTKGKYAGLTHWPLMAAQVAEWTAVYQKLDIIDECRRALAWVKANPSRQKTYGGMPAFLNNWFTRSVNIRAGPTTVVGSMKTAGNQAAVQEFLRKRGHHDVDEK